MDLCYKGIGYTDFRQLEKPLRKYLLSAPFLVLARGSALCLLLLALVFFVSKSYFLGSILFVSSLILSLYYHFSFKKRVNDLLDVRETLPGLDTSVSFYQTSLVCGNGLPRPYISLSKLVEGPDFYLLIFTPADFAAIQKNSFHSQQAMEWIQFLQGQNPKIKIFSWKK